MKRKKWMAVCFIIVMVLAVWKPAAAAVAGEQEAEYHGDGYEGTGDRGMGQWL